VAKLKYFNDVLIFVKYNVVRYVWCTLIYIMIWYQIVLGCYYFLSSFILHALKKCIEVYINLYYFINNRVYYSLIHFITWDIISFPVFYNGLFWIWFLFSIRRGDLYLIKWNLESTYIYLRQHCLEMHTKLIEICLDHTVMIPSEV